METYYILKLFQFVSKDLRLLKVNGEVFVDGREVNDSRTVERMPFLCSMIYMALNQ